MLYRLLRDQAQRYPDKIAIAGEHSRLTYGQLLHQVENKAAYFQSLNLKAGDSILVGLPPSPEFFVVFYASCAIGTTVVPALPSEKIPAPLLTAAPALAIGTKSFSREAGKRFESLKAVFVWDRNDGLHVPEPSLPFRHRKLIRSENVVAVSSSGTTGVPSLYPRPAELLLERAQLRRQILGINSDDILLATRPLNNGSSINTYVLVPLVAGCKVVVREDFQRLAFVRAVADERVTVLYTVPLVFEILASLPTSQRFDLSTLRLCVSAGAPLSRSVWEAFQRRFGISIRQAYGASHIHPIFTYSNSGLPGTVGHISGPFPLAILSEENRPLGPDQLGEIVFDYSKLSRVWKNHLRDKPNRVGKYLHTGDLGKIDRDGNLYVLGRKSPFIKVGGNRVEPAEVEDVLRSHPLIQDALVFAVNPGQTGESVGALIVTEAALTSGEIVGHCASRLDSYKCPSIIEFRKSLPRNPHGKIMHYLFAGNDADEVARGHQAQ
jgi:long-chain acyl-CoA synthetase